MILYSHISPVYRRHEVRWLSFNQNQALQQIWKVAAWNRFHILQMFHILWMTLSAAPLLEKIESRQEPELVSHLHKDV